MDVHVLLLADLQGPCEQQHTNHHEHVCINDDDAEIALVNLLSAEWVGDFKHIAGGHDDKLWFRDIAVSGTPGQSVACLDPAINLLDELSCEVPMWPVIEASASVTVF